jgi:hypothetical protein
MIGIEDITMSFPIAGSFNLQLLESRKLLSGVTLLVHGYEGNITGWVESAADAIADRVDGGASIYVMKVAEKNDKPAVTSFVQESGPALASSQEGELVIKLDWTAVDGGKYSTKEIGRAVTDYLVTRHGDVRALAEKPMHMIGHSRGASVVVAMSRYLSERGIWVDQNTYLDPHPIDGDNDFLFLDFDDQSMRVFDNVAFADNYWRTDGNAQNLDFDGEEVTGTHQGDLDATVQENPSGSAHMSVTGYYHGTIDPDASSNGDSAIKSAWYGNNSDKPSKTQTGYAFSRLGLLKRPQDGVSAPFGGTASRNASEQIGTQWPNLTNMRILEGSTIAIGPSVSLRFVRQDRDSSTDQTIFLDRDTNPYNGNNVRTLRRFTLSEADVLTASKVSIPTDDIAPGTYYIGGQVADSLGQLRIAYTAAVKFTGSSSSSATRFSETPIAPPPTAAASSTEDHDRIKDLVFTTT